MSSRPGVGGIALNACFIVSAAVIDVAIPVASTLMAVAGIALIGYFMYQNLKVDPPVTSQKSLV